jgi:hypothetical protein
MAKTTKLEVRHGKQHLLDSNIPESNAECETRNQNVKGDALAAGEIIGILE